jgi:hypothetical protein
VLEVTTPVTGAHPRVARRNVLHSPRLTGQVLNREGWIEHLSIHTLLRDSEFVPDHAAPVEPESKMGVDYFDARRGLSTTLMPDAGLRAMTNPDPSDHRVA